MAPLPDVKAVLDLIESLGLPPLETLTPDQGRAMGAAQREQRPPGPEVGEIVDTTVDGAAGPLAARIYRPTVDVGGTIVYFHGGGWVLGNATSDDPVCRDLAERARATVVSVDYRHAPEHRFPAAADDALAAVRSVDASRDQLGLDSGAVAVAGFSAGANLAAVTCLRVRDEGGPRLAGQGLVTPVADWDPTRASMADNGAGYILTSPLMEWFWDHYVPDADARHDPRVSPLRAGDLSGLPPAFITTCEHDPLRDEGEAYREALAAAGVSVSGRCWEGHGHTTTMMVDVIASGEQARAEWATAMRGFLG